MSSHRNVRTYSRRSSIKTSTKRLERSDDEDELADRRPSKRKSVSGTGTSTPKDHDLLEKPGQSSRSRATDRGKDDEVETDVDEDVRESTPVNNDENTHVRSKFGSKMSESCATSRSPSKRPQNLSSIFDDVFSSSPIASPSMSPSRTPGKAARMLGRSKTDSSIDSSPSKGTSSLGTRSHSFATSISRLPSRSQSALDVTSTTTSTNEGDEAPRRPPASSRTYAGPSRSFLVAVPVSSLPARLGEQVAQLGNDDEDFRDSYSDLRKRWGIDNSEGDAYNGADPSGSHDANEQNLNNVLFSITDLRSKGESRRFMDEAGYLFDGFDPSGSLGVWRSAATDLVINLIKPDFYKNAKAADFLGKIWDLLRSVRAGDGDKVLDAILSCFIGLLKNDAREIELLAAKPDFISVCGKLLEACADGDQLGSLEILSNFDLSQMGIKRPEKLMLQRLRSSLLPGDSVLPEGCEPSIRILISSTYAASPSKFFCHIGAVVDSLNRELASLPRRISAYMSGLPLIPEHGWNHEQLCLEHVLNCLHVLDSYLVELQYGNVTGDSDWRSDAPDVVLSERLVALVTFVNVVATAKPIPTVSLSVAVRCSESALRVLINLTNGNKPWCKLLSRNTSLVPQLVRCVMEFLRGSSGTKSGQLLQKEDQTSPFDRLCLALGVLTNINQEESSLTRTLRKTKYTASCTKSACLNGCRCTDSSNGLACLCTVYSSLGDIEDGYSVSEIQYVKGHLSLLLGLLCSSAAELQELLVHLPGPSNKAKLAHLTEAIQDFSAMFKSFSKHLENGSMEDGTDPCSDLDNKEIITSSPVMAQVSRMSASVLRTLRGFEEDLE